MRATWEALHQSLVRSTGTLTARSTFEKMKMSRPLLRRFADTGALLAHLHASGGDLDDKDRIYAVLIELVQAGGDQELATALLWLGLWPGLDAVYRRRLRHFLDQPHALVSEVGARFSGVIHNTDLCRVRRVAATLVRNVDRDIGDALKRSWAQQAAHVDLSAGDGDNEANAIGRQSCGPNLRTDGISELGLPPRLDAASDVRALRDLLVGIVGDGAELVVGAVLYGESQREVGERLGLTHDAARKRYQRAVLRIREHFERA